MNKVYARSLKILVTSIVSYTSMYGAGTWEHAIPAIAQKIDQLEEISRAAEQPSRPDSPQGIRRALSAFQQYFAPQQTLKLSIQFPPTAPTTREERTAIQNKLKEFYNRAMEVQNILDFYITNMIAPDNKALYTQVNDMFKETLIRDSKYLKDKPTDAATRLGAIERTAYEALGLSSQKRYTLSPQDINRAAEKTARELDSSTRESRFARQAQFILSRPYLKQAYDAFLQAALEADGARDFATEVCEATGSYELICPDLPLLRIDPKSSLAAKITDARQTAIELAQEINNQIAEKF